MCMYGVLVGQTCFSRLEYLGHEDRFGPFSVISKEDGKPMSTGLSRRDAIDWMVRWASWGREDARQQVDDAIIWYHEAAERLESLLPHAPESCNTTGACGQ